MRPQHTILASVQPYANWTHVCTSFGVHRWYYFPRMTRDEAIMLKTFDSKGSFPAAAAPDGSTVPASAAAPVVTPTAITNDDGAAAVSTFALHTAIDEPDPPQDARDRESIEVRCVVVY